MRDPIEQLRGRLVELGCPLPRMQRMVREVEEHREDLMRSLVAEGMTTAEAEVRANVRLGNPQVLAENLMESLWQSSWCGRHRFIAFGLLPVLGFPLFWMAILVLNLSLAFALDFGWDQKKLSVAAENPVAFHHLTLVAYGADDLAIVLVALGFCLLASRAGIRRSWMVFVFFICTFYSLFIFTYVSPHHYTIGMNSHPQWIRGAIPLLIVGLTQTNRLWQVRRMHNPFTRVV
ncbi:MAG TPA: permease prefix domain 1-containing protein [Verrucomicrobiae bacterium]|nr:permease prefix domain 1-containing protein [Verrucomicrobiae bacterium]